MPTYFRENGEKGQRLRSAILVEQETSLFFHNRETVRFILGEQMTTEFTSEMATSKKLIPAHRCVFFFDEINNILATIALLYLEGLSAAKHISCTMI